MAISSDEFRKVMGLFATGVTIVTVRQGSGAPWGFTANAFTSVSLEPPLVLFCVGHSGDSFPIVAAAEYFAVNFLSDVQAELSRRFASKQPGRFEGVEYRDGAYGAPLLADCLGYVECRKTASHAAGDHTIILGEVLAAAGAHDGDPLLFFQGAYRRPAPT